MFGFQVFEGNWYSFEGLLDSFAFPITLELVLMRCDFEMLICMESPC